MNILEGLQVHDLDFTIMPLVSIDEYCSKIDDRKVIVVGFYVTEKDPATDLASFIEKGIVRVLDTDVSPAPTEDGHYLVFVEIARNIKFPKKLLKIISEINNITNIKKWQFSQLHSKQGENYNLTLEELEKRVNLDPDSIEIDDDDTNHAQTESIATFLQNSLVESFQIYKDNLALSTPINSRSFKIVEFKNKEPKLPILINNIGDPRLMESNRLQTMLGHSYSVYVSGDNLLVSNDNGYLLLSVVD